MHATSSPRPLAVVTGASSGIGRELAKQFAARDFDLIIGTDLSKSFVQSFAAALREELKDSGGTVTSLMPGPTDTEFFERRPAGHARGRRAEGRSRRCRPRRLRGARPCWGCHSAAGCALTAHLAHIDA